MKHHQLDKTIGPELHRIKPVEGYKEEMFNKLYKICKPVIRNIVKQIDARRYAVSKDIISSYFWDKMIFIFFRYYEEAEEDIEFLKAHILKGLATYKYHILHEAYSERAEYNQSLTSLDILFDNDKEDVDFADDNEAYKEELLQILYGYMRAHLSPDAMLVFECLMTPTEYFLQRTNDGKQRITNGMLADFFNLPKAKSSILYISELRHDIEYWEQRAKIDLKHE